MTVIKKIKSFVWSKKFLINLLVLILFYIILFFCLNKCLDSRTNYGEKIKVPDLVGKNQNNLDNLLNGLNLKYEILDSIYDPTKIEGTIMEQDPLPTSVSGVHVKSGRTIKIRVSKRTQLVEMPDLVNKSQRFAEGILRNREIRCRIEYKPSKEAHGAILQQLYKGQVIAPGTKIPIGSTVKLIIGRDEVGIPLELPNLYGMTIDEARERVSAMSNMDFFPICPDCVTKADSMIARVQSQSPEYTEGAVVASGGSITVFASKEFAPK